MSDQIGEPAQHMSLSARLTWFRADHPDAAVETEMVVAEEDMAVCRATVSTSGAGAATSHGSALREEFGAAYIEAAEDRALSRVLILMGYGAEEHEAERGMPEASAPVELVSARSLLREEAPAESDYETVDEPQPIRQTPRQQPDQDAGSDEGADVTWNKFWNWARPRGYSSAKELNEMLGVDNVLAFTPREVRQMIVKYEMDNPPGGQDE